jgi:peptidoglycan/LPS O-acetylase OafA/YrhL
MTSSADRSGRAGDTARTSLAIDNLRAVVILLVLSFHSVLAYLQFLPSRPFAFDAPPFLWRAFPIVDAQRWFGFDLFCAWQDVFLMSFFLLLSGLFTWPSLARKGARAFLADRLFRLGLPFAAVVIFVVPLAHFPTYLQSATDPSLADFWRHWRQLPFWPSGPMWFLWILLVGDLLAAAVYQMLTCQMPAGRRDAVLRLSNFARAYPARFMAGLVLVSAVAYVPLALLFGPSDWAQRGPFAFQLSRPLHYAVYFLAGVAIGACGIERGLLAPDGPLARSWRRWLLVAPLLFGLWAGTTALTLPGPAPLALQILSGLSFALACFASCFAVLALAVRFARIRSAVLDSLKANAYGMYLIHYVFIVWLQYSLLPTDLPAVVKGAFVFAGTLVLSWGATAAMRRVPAIAQVIGADRPPSVAAIRPSPAPSRSRGLAR